MLKTILYMTLGIAGMVAAICSPLYGAVAVIESYLFSPQVFSPTLASFRFQFFLTAAFVVGLALHFPKQPKAVGSEGAISLLIALFAAVALGSSLWAAYDSYTARNAAFEFSKTLLVAILIPLAISNERGMRFIIYALMVGATHCAFMHVIGGNIGWVGGRYTREFGLLPDFQASVMVFFLPLLILFTIYSEKKWFRLASLFGMLLVVDSIVNSYQRAYFVAMLAEIMILGVFLPFRIVMRVAPVVGVGALAFVFVFTPPDYWDWIYTIGQPSEEASASSRFEIAEASMQMIADYPMGVGYRNYPWVSPDYLPKENLAANGTRAAHNTVFTVLCETGIVGFVIFAGMIGYALLLLRRIRRKYGKKNGQARW